MDIAATKQTLQAKLNRCRKLARAIPDGLTAKNLAEYAAEIEQQIRDLDNGKARH
jgi:hypothetical protein